MANIETFAKSGLRNLFLVLIAFSIFIDTSDHIGIVVKMGKPLEHTLMNVNESFSMVD